MYNNTVTKLKNNLVNLCLCKNEAKVEYLSATPGCSEDHAAVYALPNTWVPRESGPILANYLKQREQSHQNVCEDLLKDSKTLNEKINCKVRTLAEILLAEIHQNKRDIECVVEKCTNANLVTTNDRNNAVIQINILVSRIIQELTNFKTEVLIVERERATELKNLLQCYFQRVIGVGHKAPNELLHEFDEKMYDINQQLMSNSRTYILLEAKLRSQIDENLIIARTRLNETVFARSSIWRAQSAQPWSQEQKRSKIEYNRSDDRNSPDDANLSREFKSQSNLVEGYREVVLKMFSAISREFDELHKEIESRSDLIRECSTPAILGLQKVIEKAIYTLGIKALPEEHNTYKDVVEICDHESVLHLQKSLFKFGENLKNTYLVLHDAAHVWDAHMIRLALAQKITMASVKDLIVNQDLTELANEVITNIAIEQLRAAPDVDKLQQYYDVIMIALDRTTDLYKQHSDVELCKLEEFTNLTPYLTNLLLCEYNIYLEKNARSPVPDIKAAVNTPTIGSPRVELMSKRLLVSKAIFQTDIQNVALCRWKNGFLESFEGNMPMISDQLIQQTQMWVDERKDILRTRHLLKLMSHSIRKERIQAGRDIRLAEIRFHEARLNSHLDSIYELVDNLPTEASEYLSLDVPELYPLSQWLSSIQTPINDLFSHDPLDAEVKRLKMCSYASRLLKHRQLFVNSLDSALDQYKKSVEYRVQVARISNVRFMSQLKLFSEGGKYAAVEALKACTALVRGADALESCFNRTLDCIHHRRSQLLNMADQQILPIQKVVDEVLKFAPKGFLDKKKVATGKK